MNNSRLRSMDLQDAGHLLILNFSEHDADDPPRLLYKPQNR